MCSRPTCAHLAHLECLGRAFAEPGRLLPTGGACPGCGQPEDWDRIIRGCFARKEGTERETEAALKASQKAHRRRKKATAAETGSSSDDHDEPSSRLSTLVLATPTKKTRRGATGKT